MARQLVTIQYLRALSAVGIVLFHVSRRHDVDIPIGEGRIALFFIVSGFILWWITAGRRNDPRQFMLRRLARLVPLYWLVTSIMFVASVLGLTSHHPDGVAHYLASMLFIPHRNSLGQIFPLLMPGWTLVYEMFFCIVFALLLMAPEARRFWALTAVLGGLALCGLVFRPTSAILTIYTNQILLEFLAGVWLAHFWPRIRLSGVAAWSCLALGLGLSVILEPFRVSDYSALVAGVPALLVVAGALGLEPVAGKAIGWLRYVGDGSYSIYLWHIPVLVICESLAGRAHITSAPLLIVLETMAGVAVGLALYAVLERPLTTWLFERLDRSRARRALAPALT